MTAKKGADAETFEADLKECQQKKNLEDLTSHSTYEKNDKFIINSTKN